MATNAPKTGDQFLYGERPYIVVKAHKGHRCLAAPVEGRGQYGKIEEVDWSLARQHSWDTGESVDGRNEKGRRA